MREMIATNARFVPKKQAVIVGLMTSSSEGKLYVQTRYFLRNYLPMAVTLIQELATNFGQ
jgi:hypothetical protein